MVSSKRRIHKKMDVPNGAVWDLLLVEMKFRGDFLPYGAAGLLMLVGEYFLMRPFPLIMWTAGGESTNAKVLIARALNLNAIDLGVFNYRWLKIGPNLALGLITFLMVSRMVLTFIHFFFWLYFYVVSFSGSICYLGIPIWETEFSHMGSA